MKERVSCSASSANQQILYLTKPSSEVMLSANAFLDFSMRGSEPNKSKSKLFTISLRVGIITMHFQVKLAWLQFLIAIRSAIPLTACLVFVLLCLKSDEFPNREKTTSERIDGGSTSQTGHTLTPLHIEMGPIPGMDAKTALKHSNHCQKSDLYWSIEAPPPPTPSGPAGMVTVFFV